MTDSNNQTPGAENKEQPPVSPRSSLDSLSRSSRSPSLRASSLSGAPQSHRLSLGDTLRAVPPSPRARRQPSLTQSAIQSLIDNPPSRNSADPAFSGRDWTQISIGELINPDDLRFVEADTPIEDATNVRLRLFPLLYTEFRIQFLKLLTVTIEFETLKLTGLMFFASSSS